MERQLSSCKAEVRFEIILGSDLLYIELCVFKCNSGSIVTQILDFMYSFGWPALPYVLLAVPVVTVGMG